MSIAGGRRHAIFAALVLLVATTTLSGCGQSVPDLKGMTVSQAEKSLESQGFAVGGIEYRPEATGAPGVVVGQTPVAGDRHEAGAIVNLVVAGREPVRVPRLIGLSESEAKIALATLGLVAGESTHESSEGVAAGEVVSQMPTPQESVPWGSSVTLTVSNGPSSAKVPSLKGLPEAEARARLEQLGFAVAVVHRYDAEDTGIVVAQKPGGGVVARGSLVTLTVSKGPTPKPAVTRYKGTFLTYQVAGGARTGYGNIEVGSQIVVAQCPYLIEDNDKVWVTKRADGTWIVTGFR